MTQRENPAFDYDRMDHDYPRIRQTRLAAGLKADPGPGRRDQPYGAHRPMPKFAGAFRCLTF